MDMEQISREQLGWLAGIIDGEGCITAGWRYYAAGDAGHKNRRSTLYVWLSVSNRDCRLLKKVSEIYKLIPGVGFYYTTAKKDNGFTWCINLTTTGKGSTKKVLETVLPLLTAKKEQAETAIELIDYRESLGYLPSRDSKRIKLQDDPQIILYVERLHRLKKELPSLPSETKRRANQILEF